MLTPEGLEHLAREIEAQGFDPATAARYAALIGDTPELDEHQRVIVRDGQGLELARVQLRFKA